MDKYEPLSTGGDSDSSGVWYIYLIQIARTVSYILYFYYAETCNTAHTTSNSVESLNNKHDCNIRHILKSSIVDFAVSVLALWILVELGVINAETVETALAVIVLSWLVLTILRLASLTTDKRPSFCLKTIVVIVTLLLPLVMIH